MKNLFLVLMVLVSFSCNKDETDFSKRLLTKDLWKVYFPDQAISGGYMDFKKNGELINYNKDMEQTSVYDWHKVSDKVIQIDGTPSNLNWIIDLHIVKLTKDSFNYHIQDPALGGLSYTVCHH